MGRASGGQAEPTVLAERRALQMDYDIHVSEEFGFIYFNNPKAGCSTTKATLNLACAARLGVPLAYTDLEQIHAREHNVLKTPKQVGDERFEAMAADPAVVRFCVLREPIGRVCSAYASKLRHDSPQRRKLNAALGRPLDHNWPDINAFVAVLASDEAIRDFDPHWRLQYRQVCADRFDFTLTGFQEELELGLRMFAGLVFGDRDIRLFDARAAFKQNVSDGTAQRDALSAASRRSLERAYADDFAFYDREWARMHPDKPATPGAG